ncbi:MAG: rhodanese-like domain-containing protein [Cyanobacteria bacterium J06638_28]
MSEIQDAVDAVQEIAVEVSPAPVEFNRVTSATDVKARLDWGEPALTIIDIRDRQSFNEKRIMGAIQASSEEAMARVQQTLEADRDIYLYGASDAEAKQVAAQFDAAGFKRVAVLEGGLPAWDAIGGATEGRNAEPNEVSPGFVKNVTES